MDLSGAYTKDEVPRQRYYSLSEVCGAVAVCAPKTFRITSDLKELADLLAPHNFRLAYEN